LAQKKPPYSDEEFNLYKEHTTFGFLILSGNPAIPPTASAVALQHHEWQNGQGYPRGLKGDNKLPYKTINAVGRIHRFAEIVAVADGYDSLVSKFSENDPLIAPEKAIAGLVQNSGVQYNQTIVQTFIKTVPIFPVGAKFRVVNSSDYLIVGAKGVVAKQNSQNLDKPTLLLLYTKKGNSIQPPKMVEMANDTGLKIELIL